MHLMFQMLYDIIRLWGADVEPDDVVDQVYGELEGVVDKLAKEAQRGTLPRFLFSKHLYFDLHWHFPSNPYSSGKPSRNPFQSPTTAATATSAATSLPTATTCKLKSFNSNLNQQQQLVSWKHFKLTTFILTFRNGVQGWSEARTIVSYDLRLESCNLHWTSGHRCHSSYPPWLISQPTSHC